MGNNPDKKKQSRYIYEFKLKNNGDFNLKKLDSKVEVIIDDKNKIHDSKKRSVYKGKIDNKKDCVVKVYKKGEQIFYYNKDFFNELNNIFIANNLSLIYTEKYKNETEFVPMNFVDFYVGSKEEKKVTELKGILSDETSLKSEIGEDLNLIENYIDSKKFRLFVNEYCHVNHTDSKNIPLFMHWNWVETNGTFLVCDLRGEINPDNNGFELSSPSLQSKDKSYGNSDNGVYSLITFIAEHKHTEHCKDLRWPDDKHIEIAKNISANSTSEKCDRCQEIYEEIISSAFFTKPETSNNLHIIIPLIIVIIFLFGFGFGLFYFCRKRKREKNTIVNSTQIIKQTNSKLDLTDNKSNNDSVAIQVKQQNLDINSNENLDKNIDEGQISNHSESANDHPLIG